MHPPQPILVTDLFPETLESLLALLAERSPSDWAEPTVCIGWTVKEVALHLLAVEISNLSRRRDGFSLQPKEPIQDDADLLSFINGLNESWLEAARRISPRLLIDLLRLTGQQANQYFASLDPFALGGPVSWAGPGPAPVWLDLAREYTERWHHQQHIRDAVGQPGLKQTRFLGPVLDAFVRALPYTYREVTAPTGSLVTLTLTGPGGGQWSIRQEAQGWQLYTGTAPDPTAEVILDSDDAWRLFTKGLEPFEVHGRAQIKGDARLGARVFEMVSIIA